MSEEKINPATDKAEAERYERCVLASLAGLISQGWVPERAAKEAIVYGQAMYAELEYKKVNDRINIETTYMSFHDAQLTQMIRRLEDTIKDKDKELLDIAAKMRLEACAISGCKWRRNG